MLLKNKIITSGENSSRLRSSKKTSVFKLGQWAAKFSNEVQYMSVKQWPLGKKTVNYYRNHPLHLQAAVKNRGERLFGEEPAINIAFAPKKDAPEFRKSHHLQKRLDRKETFS